MKTFLVTHVDIEARVITEWVEKADSEDDLKYFCALDDENSRTYIKEITEEEPTKGS